MHNLSTREKVLISVCFLVIFAIANIFAIQFATKKWANQDSLITDLTNELKDLELWLEDRENTETRKQWLVDNTPIESSMSKAHGNLLQSMQDDLFERKINIEKQALMKATENKYFKEVAVKFTLRGEEKSIIKWLITLQGASKFQVIKYLKLSIDSKSKEELPQAICEIEIARWLSPGEEESIEKNNFPTGSSDQQNQGNTDSVDEL